VTSEILTRLAARAAGAGVELPGPLAEKLVVYYDLLQRWNRKINLTSISNPDEAIDRLLLEPLAAAVTLPRTPRLIDLGSGGGSPALPLALVLAAPLLVLVESRSRKAAFLREAVRELAVPGVVENSRFEELADRVEYRQAMDLVSIRAVRLDTSALTSAAGFLGPDGLVALFEGAAAGFPTLPAGLTTSGTVPLLQRSRLLVLKRA
jgi:16S rRNA (guanine527-N7)-methyltransferase